MYICISYIYVLVILYICISYVYNYYIIFILYTLYICISYVYMYVCISYLSFTRTKVLVLLVLQYLLY
jgi:hypothetical protein